MTLASSVHPALTLVFLERERSFRLCNKGTRREAVVWGDTRARFSFTHLQICTCVGQAVRAKRGGRSRTVRLLTRLKGLSCQGVERWRYAKRARTITGRARPGNVRAHVFRDDTIPCTPPYCWRTCSPSFCRDATTVSALT